MNALELPDNIETLFKVEPPLTELKDGFGFTGVLLSEKTTGNLQCHICGKFWYNLSSHIHRSHKIKAREYRIKFQLPLSFPLINVALSKKLREQYQQEYWKRSPPNKNGQITKKHKGRYGKSASYARNNDSFHNKYGLCEAQMQARYLLIADLLERDPSQREIEAKDSKLWWAIKNRHGSINVFKKKYGFRSYSQRHKDNGINKVLKLKDTSISHSYKLFNNFSKEEKEGIIKTYGSIRRAVTFLGA